MDFISNRQEQIQEMMQAIGINSIDELFKDIPGALKRKAPEIDDGLSEYEGMKEIEAISHKNTFATFDNYLGAGSYEHHVPAITASICSKSEFLTSYTPYQPEASQGMLQVIFEFQSAICALTGMDVANASLYDGASACAEAVLMALRSKSGKTKIVISEALHPHYRAVVNQYIDCHNLHVETISHHQDGSLNVEEFFRKVDEQTAAVLVQYPNFFGIIDSLDLCFAHAKKVEALSIVCANPIAYGLFKSASELGADIAVGDGQPFGLHMSYGGPYVGYIACKQELIRQLPGRIVGETVDSKGRRGFVLTLQAREQHIRREKATSNICTNQALAALACLVGMVWYGKNGVKELALTNYQRAHYLADCLAKVAGVTIHSKNAFFNEFVISFNKPLEHVYRIFREHKIEPGLDLGRFYTDRKDCLLVCVTETKSLEKLTAYLTAAKEVSR